MKTTYTHNETRASLLIETENGTTAFHLDANPTNFEALGIEADQSMIESENERAETHQKLISLFEKDETMIEIFAQKLLENPNTGYLEFVNENIKS